MEKTADLAMIQKTNIDTLHKEGKSQRIITERCGCLQSAVSKHIKIQSWLEGRNWVGKGAQATGMTASLRIQSSKADSKTWESFTRSELKLESVHQESPRSDVFRKRATKPLLNQRQRQNRLTWAVEKKNWTVAQWSKVLFSDKSKFCFSVGYQGLESGGRVERLRIQAAWSPVWSFRSQWWFGCRDVCWCWSIVFYQVQSQCSRPPGDFKSTLCFHLLTSFMEMLISFSSRTLAPAHTAKTTSNMPDLKPIWNLWDIFKRKRRNCRSELKAEPQADRFHATPHWCWSLC